MKPGDIVCNIGPNRFAKLFSDPLTAKPSGRRKYLGMMNDIGLVLELHGSDAHVMSQGICGWCYVGNLKELRDNETW